MKRKVNQLMLIAVFFAITFVTCTKNKMPTSSDDGDGIKWQQTNGPYGGIIYSFAINSSGHIFAGTNGGGVYRSVQSTTSVK